MSQRCFSKELAEWGRLVGNLEFGDATPLLAPIESVNHVASQGD